MIILLIIDRQDRQLSARGFVDTPLPSRVSADTYCYHFWNVLWVDRHHNTLGFAFTTGTVGLGLYYGV